MGKQVDTGDVEPSPLGDGYVVAYANSPEDLKTQIQERIKDGWICVGDSYKLIDKIYQSMKHGD